jgi:hypothetical protein
MATRGAVFVQTNDIHGNAILAYRRSEDGELTLVGRDSRIGRGKSVPRGGRLEPGTTA